eukprot:TRINITY_DN30376_c0_g1_i1.p1 TRINITY_DN30376_c0_g1~~TRINITY_DN30376_c0_g1_i1.p1  ORF type:complete len:496 (+),score=92.99 TRINITY_DN30376_c0_g1_i1:92-1579(+)
MSCRRLFQAAVIAGAAAGLVLLGTTLRPAAEPVTMPRVAPTTPPPLPHVRAPPGVELRRHTPAPAPPSSPAPAQKPEVAASPPALPAADGGQVDFASASSLAGSACSTRPAVKGGGQALALEVCWSPQTCVGHLRLRHAETTGSPCGPQGSAGGISTDGWWAEWLRRHHGPDGLWAVAEGEQEVAPVALRYAGECVYEGAWGLTLPGECGLAVKWETDSWWGTQETKATVASFRNKYVTRWQPRVRCVGPSRWAAALRPAPGAGVAWGSYVRGATPPGRPAWAAPVKGGELQWRPVGPAAGAPRGERAAILRRCGKRHVVFAGDSQVRTVWRHWQALLRERRAETAKTYNASEVHGSHTVSFFWDPYLEHARAVARLPPADALVLGFGAWPASFGQWLHSRYDTFVGGWKVVVWVGSPAWPKPRRDTKGFRITNARLGLWNHLSRMHFQSAGLSTADIFTLSWVLPKMHRGDGMHYDNSVVLYAAAERLLPLVCP